MLNSFVTKNIQWEKYSLFNKWHWENWISIWKEWNVDSFFTPYAKVNSKWVKDLNVRPETITAPPEENKWSKLLDIGLSHHFFGLDPKSKGNKSKNKQVGLLQMKNLLCFKKQLTKWKGNLQNIREAYTRKYL